MNEKAKRNDLSEEPDKALRLQAEKIILEKMIPNTEDTEELTVEETRALLYELRVHQIELEMQNEELRRTQEQLETARAKYFSIYDLAPAGYFTLSENGLIVEANLCAANMVGMERKELVMQPISRFILKDDQDIYYLHRKKLFKVGETQVWEQRMVKSDGTSFWVYLEASTVQAEDDTPLCLLVASDISARKLTEEALGKSEQENAFRAELLMKAPAIAAFHDKNMNIVWANEAYEKATGLSARDMANKKCYTVWNLSKSCRNCPVAKAIETGESQEAEITPKNQEHWPETQGSWLSRATPVRNQSGTIIGAIEIAFEITALKQAEEALVESEATVRKKLKALVEPEGDVGNLALADIIDREALQSILEDFYRLTNIGSAILDIEGNILVAVGWQDICVNYHRKHPETLKNCLESDLVLSKGVQTGTFKAYKCRNNLWDIATPILVGDKKLGSIYLGQFFYEDEVPDIELFRSQAREYGFDEDEYLAALNRVPRWSRERVNTAMTFYLKLAEMISSLGYSRLKLSRTLVQKEQAIDQLAESEANLREAQDIARIGRWKLDLATNHLEWTAGIYSLLEVQRENFAATYTSFMHFIHPDDRALVDKAYRNSVANKTTYEIEHRIVLKDGRIKWVNEIGRTEYDESGNPVCSIGIVQEITEHKQAEEEKNTLEAQLQQAQKMETAGLLAGGVAHDFNNMLGVILGHAEIALEQIEPGHELYDSLLEIKEAAERSANLTRQLLAFARKQNVAPKVLDTNATIEGMLKMVKRLIGENIELVWSPGETVWQIKMDPIQIDQILVNLCVNSCDAIRESGKIMIETGNVSFDYEDCVDRPGFSSGEYIVLTISDDGGGISIEAMSHVFEPFFTTKELGKGTGLGLATVYGIVRQNNGFINVYSEPEQGTTFKIYLPRYTGTIENAGKIHTSEPKRYGREIILLVEDETGILKMTTILLERLGYTVLPASTPGKALELAREQAGEIQLLMTDVVMPEMNGRELAKKLTSQYPHLKCLFMSGYTPNVIAQRGAFEDGVHFIQKPFSTNELAARIREALDSVK